MFDILRIYFITSAPHFVSFSSLLYNHIYSIANHDVWMMHSHIFTHRSSGIVHIVYHIKVESDFIKNLLEFIFSDWVFCKMGFESKRECINEDALLINIFRYMRFFIVLYIIFNHFN